MASGCRVQYRDNTRSGHPLVPQDGCAQRGPTPGVGGDLLTPTAGGTLTRVGWGRTSWDEIKMVFRKLRVCIKILQVSITVFCCVSDTDPEHSVC